MLSLDLFMHRANGLRVVLASEDRRARDEGIGARMGDGAQLIMLPIGHFDIYLGKWFERSSSEQLAFFSNAFAVPGTVVETQ